MKCFLIELYLKLNANYWISSSLLRTLFEKRVDYDRNPPIYVVVSCYVLQSEANTQRDRRACERYEWRSAKQPSRRMTFLTSDSWVNRIHGIVAWDTYLLSFKWPLPRVSSNSKINSDILSCNSVSDHFSWAHYR